VNELQLRGEAMETEVARLREECRALLVELERRADRLMRAPRALVSASRSLRAHPVAVIAGLALAAGLVVALRRYR
jgi:hypothetical protein